jgi:hypothetical protein
MHYTFEMLTQSRNGFASKELSIELRDICESTHQTFLLEKEMPWWGLRIVGVKNIPAVDVTSTDPDNGASGPQRVIIALGFRGQITHILNTHYEKWLSPTGQLR